MVRKPRNNATAKMNMLTAAPWLDALTFAFAMLPRWSLQSLRLCTALDTHTIMLQQGAIVTRPPSRTRASNDRAIQKPSGVSKSHLGSSARSNPAAAQPLSRPVFQMLPMPEKIPRCSGLVAAAGAWKTPAQCPPSTQKFAHQ